MSKDREVLITINGQYLVPAQSMAVCVALTSYLLELQDSPTALGDDEHGRAMTALYRQRLEEVLTLF